MDSLLNNATTVATNLPNVSGVAVGGVLTVGTLVTTDATALIAAGKVKGGRAIGATNAAGDSVVDPGWSGDRNIWPEDIEATIYSALGIDYTKVIHAPELGRGFYYVPDTDPYTYAPIRELF